MKNIKCYWTIALLLLFSATPTSDSWADRLKIAVITSPNSAVYDEAFDGFKSSLKKANLDIDYTIFDIAQKNMLEELTAAKVDLIHTIGTMATIKVFRAKPSLPIIFSSVLGPVTVDLVGENIAGVFLNIPLKKQLETIKILAPTKNKIGLLFNPELNTRTVEEAKTIATGIGLAIHPRGVNDYKDISPDIKNWLSTVDVLWIIPDNVICKQANIQHLLLQALQSETPVVGISAEFVKSGALVAFTADYNDCGKQAGEIAAGFFNGKTLSQFNAELPRKTHIYLNKKIAQKLGITIPGNILKAATEVYGD